MLRFFNLRSCGKLGDPELCMVRSLVKEMGMYDARFGLGKRARDVYPEHASIYMSDDSPGIQLLSLLGNTCNTLLVSSELRAVIEKHCTNEIEYLPFTLYDHRKRVYSRDYCIVNPIGTFDCLDLKASDIVWGRADPTRVSLINEHVLDRKKVENAPQLFRVEKDPMTYVLRYELAKEISDRKFTNIFWKELKMNGAAQ